jgi:hypothetical protein
MIKQGYEYLQKIDATILDTNSFKLVDLKWEWESVHSRICHKASTNNTNLDITIGQDNLKIDFFKINFTVGPTNKPMQSVKTKIRPSNQTQLDNERFRPQNGPIKTPNIKNRT